MNCNWSEYRWQKDVVTFKKDKKKGLVSTIIKRYYKAILHRDLLGDLVLTVVNGGLKSRLGHIEHFACDSIESANRMIEDIMIEREKHGYDLCKN